MGIEIERKFKVVNTTYRQLAPGVYYKQGYLQTNPECTIRVRIVDQNAYLTIKGLSNGASRAEYEYRIPLKDADEMIESLCRNPTIEKYRYHIEHKGFVWEVDEFIGDNEGLIIAEIELPSEDTNFPKPAFIGEEVTGHERYYNSNLALNPYKNWKAEI